MLKTVALATPSPFIGNLRHAIHPVTYEPLPPTSTHSTTWMDYNETTPEEWETVYGKVPSTPVRGRHEHDRTFFVPRLDGPVVILLNEARASAVAMRQ